MTILIQVVYFLLNDGALSLNFRGTENAIQSYTVTMHLTRKFYLQHHQNVIES